MLARAVDVLEAVEVVFPDLGGLVLGEFRVVEGQVEAGAEGVVDSADAVSGEEEDARVVFEDAEEDWTC